MTELSRDVIEQDLITEVSRFRGVVAGRIKHLALQRVEASDPEFAKKIDAATQGIASIVAGLQDFQDVVFRRVSEADAARADAAQQALDLHVEQQALKARFPDFPASGNGPAALAELHEARATALLVTLSLAVVTANAMIAGDEDGTLFALLEEAAATLLEALADGAMPGIGFFLAIQKKANEIRNRPSQQAKTANAIFADLNRLIASTGQWRRVHDEVVAALDGVSP